jgi:hypothetical protein
MRVSERRAVLRRSPREGQRVTLNQWDLDWLRRLLIDPEEKFQASKSKGSNPAPEGCVVEMPNGARLVKRGGKWITLSWAP